MQSFLTTICIFLVNYDRNSLITSAFLYPRESETRETISLNGIWNFVTSDPFRPIQGLEEKWFDDDLEKVAKPIPMPVPASYNDITCNSSIRDHMGTVWYDRKFFVPKRWSKGSRVWIHFGSVNYEALVWINGKKVIKHEIGHLPFQAEVTKVLKYGYENRITVLCDNVLLQTTLPQGRVIEIDYNRYESKHFDFFNYAGIHRSVTLYATPEFYIEDISVTTAFTKKQHTGFVHYEIHTGGTRNKNKRYFIDVCLIDREGLTVAKNGSGHSGTITVKNVVLWWPYLMHPDPGYLYTLKTIIRGDQRKVLDAYSMKIGIRTIAWNSNSLLLNERPVYLRGFGRHEDSEIRGRGFDLVMIVKDINLLKWIGANAYRTSHYPYSEESMDLADEHGLMIIDECSATNMYNLNQAVLHNHQSAIRQLIQRDKNHPSVIMWSIANEPMLGDADFKDYFRDVIESVRHMDSTRPITAAIASLVNASFSIGQYLDVISFNRYNGWYSYAGQLNEIKDKVVQEAQEWMKVYRKPVIISEYGAGTLKGLSAIPPHIWTEEYQLVLFAEHFKAFDQLRADKWFVGEFVWNFADFQTPQGIRRVDGNKKGVFTRARRAKAVAFLLRQRYFSICLEERSDCEVPDDLFLYVTQNQPKKIHKKFCLI